MARHIVSYFGNRYLDHFERDLQEIRDHGFNVVVHCVTEADLQWGMGRVAEMFERTRAAGLECWADPWGLARVFGGEAHSGFLARGERPCMDNPAFVELVRTWTDAVIDAGAETIFWDEPDLHACGCCEGRVVEFLDTWTQHAAQRSGPDGQPVRSSVCICSFDKNVELLGEVAALPAVSDIATDPYMHGDDRPDPEVRVGKWADLVRAAGERAGISSHLWVQGFDLPDGLEHLFVDAARVAREHGVHDIGFWGYRAAEATSGIAPHDPQLVWRMAREVFAGAAVPAALPGNAG
jgi:hypothetical protein